MIRETSTNLILDPRKGDSLSSEDFKLKMWFSRFGNFLKKHPNDNEFRGKMSDDSPDSFWNSRPLLLKRLDFIPQFWFHDEEVGKHIYHVVMNLGTSSIVDEPKSEIDRVKVIRATALLHDNGKRNDPSNPYHPIDSAQEVEQYLEWMGFNNKEKELCLRLIAYHDFLGKVANPHTKETVDDLIKYFPTLAELECLYFFTFADIFSIKKMRLNMPNIFDNLTEVYKKARERIMREKKVNNI